MYRIAVDKEQSSVRSDWHSLVVEQVKYSVLSLIRLGSLLWLGFDPWEILHAAGVTKKERKKKKERNDVYNVLQKGQKDRY